jgi:hypothetical protein
MITYWLADGRLGESPADLIYIRTYFINIYTFICIITDRHCEERSDVAIFSYLIVKWIATPPKAVRNDIVIIYMLLYI